MPTPLTQVRSARSLTKRLEDRVKQWATPGAACYLHSGEAVTIRDVRKNVVALIMPNGSVRHYPILALRWEKP